ncbi:MAG TPA: TetR/AcrR family transcriptional regulator, partial [Spirochaetota bacterium]|nr:TetR/AcrR family transcriptional regulator [Spirochaetota bacterium]
MNREEKAKRNKKAILSAIKRCLDRVAYSYISMQDVADEAGISKGGLRYYYPTKESLYMALIEDFFTEMDEDHLSI